MPGYDMKIEARSGGQAEGKQMRARLKAPEAFDAREVTPDFRSVWHPRHDRNQLGRASRAVRRRLASSCAGWKPQPTAEEFYEAVHVPNPDERQRQIIETWLQEATSRDLLEAWAENAYTWRELAGAIHRSGLKENPRCRELNALAGP